MAACLRCDNISCGRVITEHDDELIRWWRVGRYGDDIIPEPGRIVDRPTVEMHSMTFINSSGELQTPGVEMSESDIEALGDEMMEDFMEETGGIDSGTTLHFCTAQCLADWSSQAAQFEG